MVFRKPSNASALVYHTQRPLSRGSEGDESGFCHMWVFKPACSCGGLMNKPKKKAKNFVCDKCGKEFPVGEVVLVAMGEYDCPYCKYHGEFELEWFRTKTGRKFVFKCGKCGEKLEITKLK